MKRLEQLEKLAKLISYTKPTAKKLTNVVERFGHKDAYDKILSRMITGSPEDKRMLGAITKQLEREKKILDAVKTQKAPQSNKSYSLEKWFGKRAPGYKYTKRPHMRS